MTEPAWNELRLEDCRQALEKNGFRAWVARSKEKALDLVRENYLSDGHITSASWGDSLTAEDLGVVDLVRNARGVDFIETFDSTAGQDVILERRKQALLTDLFIAGTNAVTLDGALVNLDMVGNRITGIMFGPKQVLLCIGANKIVPDLEAAMARVKEVAATQNALRHLCKTPCVKTGRCMDCKSPDRICNTWSIIERCHPRGRIGVILVDQNLGL